MAEPQDNSGGNAVRMNISIPRDLKNRMDGVAEAVNWSRVAGDAFEVKLLELTSRREAKTTDEVIVRLKAAAELEKNEGYQAGFQAGQAWAREAATPKQLRRIAAHIDSCLTGSTDWWDVDSPNWQAPFGATDRFAIAARPEARRDPRVLTDFWEQALGEDDAGRARDADFLRGFGEGVIEVWEVVKDEL
jgi:hypothetical protein